MRLYLEVARLKKNTADPHLASIGMCGLCRCRIGQFCYVVHTSTLTNQSTLLGVLPELGLHEAAFF